MAHINVLDQNTINKIAAGEVIERPASVVKELLENAIDAQATAVTVEIREGGTSLIRVTDNGSGILKEEVALAFLPHSTSKIKSVEDLFTVASLGFRGEALASIASVSQVELITKTEDALLGSRYQIEGGLEKSVEDIGAPEGTTFLVRNLFYNTPARKKFLKTPQTEGAHVAELVEKIALSHPDISIRFIQNNQNKLHTSGNHNLKDIIYTVFGREIAANLLPVDVQQDILKIHGFAGKPVIARGNRNYENYYINGRYIKSSLVSKAIEEAYKPFMMQHKYPFTLFHLTIEPEYLDVNVHPTKMELRFRDGELIYQLIYQAVSEALAHKELIPEVSLSKNKEEKQADALMKLPLLEPFEKRRRLEADHPSGTKRLIPADSKDDAPDTDAFNTVYQTKPSFDFLGDLKGGDTAGRSRYETSADGKDFSLKNQEHAMTADRHGDLADQGNHASHVLTRTEETGRKENQESAQLDLFDEKLLEPKNRIKHKLIGQLFDTYWLVEFHEQLFIIDQHAAHEKVLYEKTMKSLKDRDYTSQLINPPIILTLNMNEELLLKKHLDCFTGIGFEIEHFGGKEYAVRAVPGNLFSIAKRELLMEMLDGLSEEISSHNPDLIYEKVASMSCKAAVKGNNRLSVMEANQLIDQLLGLENPYACPHGRPTIISMAKHELEKKFKRIV